MSSRYQASSWSVELPAGWDLEEREGYVAARSPRGAELRFTSFAPAEANLGAERWTEVAAHFDRIKRRAVTPARCGDFGGYEVQFAAAGSWILGWALAANAVPLSVTYRCTEADAGVEDAALYQILTTLRLTGARLS